MKNTETKLSLKRNWQVTDIGLLFYDIGAVNGSFFLALWLRFDCQYSLIPGYYLEAFFKFAPLGYFRTFGCIKVFGGLPVTRNWPE